MGMQQAPQAPKSPWSRYGPFIVIVAIVVIVAVVAVLVFKKDDKKKTSAQVSGNESTVVTKSGTNGVPLFYSDAKANGDADKHTWQDTCDKTRGVVAMPAVTSPPCVEKFSGDNGGATAQGVTKDTIRIGYFIPKPDPLFDQALKATGTYDPPDQTAKVYEAYFHMYEKLFELYGRHLELVRIDGTGSSSDPVAARADADTAASKNLFAVIGGPPQASKPFSEELAAKHVVCAGGCIISQPEKFILDHEPYVYPFGPTPDQTNTLTVDLIKNQLLNKPVQWGGSDVNGKPRTFTMLTYNTPDGQYTASWDDMYAKLNQAGAKVVTRTDYYLNFSTLPADARTIAAKLKSANATDIIFSGDPLFPQYLTAEMTKQGYFPEWVMSGTVLADTVAFAKNYDQRQWRHAFGINISHPLTQKTDRDSYKLHEWWYGTPPETENNFEVIDAPVRMLMTGLQVAGPHLTAQAFKNGLDAIPPSPSPDTPSPNPIYTWGNHGLWPGEADDVGGSDNVSLLWWDPDTNGQDETGKQANGQYRILNNGTRYVASRFPTEPLPFFDRANTVTMYPQGQPNPAFIAPTYPVPADAPNPQKK